MRTVLALLTAAVLAVGAIVLGVVATDAYRELGELAGRRTAAEEAMAGAREAAPDLLSYDYRSIEEDLARAGRLTTGELTTHFRKLQETMVAKARQERAVLQATVEGAAVERSEATGSRSCSSSTWPRPGRCPARPRPSRRSSRIV